MADPVSPLTPQMQTLIEQLLQTQADRSASTTPIHQAAMAMAQHMAPGYAQSAMTGGAGGGATPSGLGSGGLTPSLSSGGGPGVGTTVSLAAVAALLKNPSFMAAIKTLIGGGADPTFGGAIQGNKPFAGGTGFPDVPAIGGGGATGDPTQPGGAQGQMGSIGLPFSSAWGGSGSAPTGPGGQQGNYYDDPARQSH